MTILPLRKYFINDKFYAYFLNIIGNIHYALPGLFPNNPIPYTVNGQLWTVPWELKCYIVLAVLAFFGVVRNRRLLVAFCLGSIVLLLIYEGVFKRVGISGFNDTVVPGRALVISFLLGVALYQFRRWVPYRLDVFLFAFACYFVLTLVPFGSTLLTVPMAYITVYVGLWSGHKLRLIRTGDYSYGMYIYGFAIQQAIVSFGPGFQHWYIVMPLALLLVSCFAAFSWFVVERPTLKLRKYLPIIDVQVRRVQRKMILKVREVSGLRARIGT